MAESNSDFSVLIVDDHERMRAVLTTLVSRIGFRDVVSAANGDQALEKLHDQQFDLVLCDYHMSPCDGFELKRRLDADEVYADMAFVMVTADSEMENSLPSWTNAPTSVCSGF